jgi:S1-C subfamily serine protease
VLESWLFDIALLGVLVAYGVYGYRNGLVHALGGFAGLLVGAVVAFFLVPVLANWVPSTLWRFVLVLVAAVILLVGGHSLGVSLAHRVSRAVKRRALRVADRVLGAVINVVATALVVSLLASSVAAFGIPGLSRVLASSTVLRTISAIVPDPVEVMLAQLRSTLVQDGLPAITEALGGVVNPPTLPNDVDTGSEALSVAAQSVVRVTGTAPACGQNQAGSGFVVSDDRVVTNAHVVAGVTEPLIETPGGQVLAGTIVYFDPNDDLAIIAVKGLRAPPLVLADTAGRGAEGVIDGYPFGGPFVTTAAKVLSVDTARVADIYGATHNPREVYTLATTVQEGDSGGPFLDKSGHVVGIVFARAANTANVGYAMTMAEVDPVAAQAPSLTKRVDSGACSRG